MRFGTPRLAFARGQGIGRRVHIASESSMRQTHVVLYDDECPLCTFQMRMLSWLDWFNLLSLVPLSDARAKALAPSLTREALSEAIHCITPQGRIYRGARCLRFVGMRLPLVCAPGIDLVDSRSDFCRGTDLSMGEPQPACSEPAFWLQGGLCDSAGARTRAGQARLKPRGMRFPLATGRRARKRPPLRFVRGLGPDAHWIGELSSSALSTATAITALATVDRHGSGSRHTRADRRRPSLARRSRQCGRRLGRYDSKQEQHQHDSPGVGGIRCGGCGFRAPRHDQGRPSHGFWRRSEQRTSDP